MLLEQRIVLPELSKLDARELRQELGEGIQFKEESLTTDKVGEPMTVAAIVVLGAAAIKAIAMWALKDRTRTEIVLEIESLRADGTVERRVGRVKLSSASSAPASVIDAIGSAVGASTEIVDEAKRLAGSR